MPLLLPTLLRALVLAFVFIAQTQGQSQTSASTTSSASMTLSETTNASLSSTSSRQTTTSLTRVVQVFFIDERSYEGLPYTMLHRDQVLFLALFQFILFCFCLGFHREPERPATKGTILPPSGKEKKKKD